MKEGAPWEANPTSRDRELTLQACGKINLCLDVVRRRPDGYHDIRGIFQSISLADEVTLRVTLGGRGIHLRCDHPGVPAGPTNLAWRAAQLLLDRLNGEAGVEIHIVKRIPIAAGLGGGSADAAATLIGLRKLLQLPISDGELARLGRELGADVPFCLRGGTALAEGIGDLLEDIPCTPAYAVLVLTPKLYVSTAEVFRAFDPGKVDRRPSVEGMKRHLEGSCLPGIAEEMVNVLETVTFPLHPQVAELAERMKRLACGAVMSGSGPSIIGLFADLDGAQRAMAALEGEDVFLWCGHPSPRGVREAT
ncbi:MAG: 4-(cytidine 5'-diphospho)-2-C-methyl-D-erythritol kinase [Firmicutes bacterium]|nr:4-(cytidine 5'-diphospho)-2-C-methyl-D-erythritol kinase [Bacillota bacterium]